MKNYYTLPKRRPALRLILLSVCCVFISSFLSIPTVHAQLQGTYTIGGPDGNYASFSEAATALESEGISGPTTFKVRPGTYSEELILGNIAGNTCEQTIIFESESEPAENEALSVSVQTIRVNGADGLTFRRLIISQVDITAGSNCITFENNSISGLLNAVSGPGEQANNHHVYRNNSFSSGIRKVKEGEFNPASPDLDEGLEISGNRINITDHRSRNTYHGIELSAQRDFIINNNTIAIEDERNGIHAISLINAWYGKEIRGNTISIRSLYGQGTGIRTSNGFPERVSENRISLRSADNIEGPFGEDEIALGGGTGILVSTGKTESGEVLIANNDIQVDGYDRRSALGSLIALHIGETPTAGDIIKVYHNSLHVGGFKDGYDRLNAANTFVAEAVADNSLYILNNIFSKFTDGGGGYAYNILHPSSVAVSDHNLFDNFRQHGSRDDLAWGDATVSSLEEWQALTGHDLNSIAGGPYARKGIRVQEVDKDIEGLFRRDPPSIGAYEINEEDDRVPLEGTYTIGSENSHYTTFNEAITALRENGITGPVTFKVRPGTYQGSFSIPSFWGNSCENMVTFEGESGSNTDVIVQPSTSYTILLNEADGITFRNMSIIGSRKVIEIRPGTDCISLENNVLQVVPSSPFLSTVIVDDQSTTTIFSNHHTYRNNVFVDGDIGLQKTKDINLVQDVTILDEGLIIESNEFRNQEEISINIAGQKDFRINRNTITQQSGGTGIQLRISLLGEEIIGNTINISGGETNKHTHFGGDDGVGILAQYGAAKRLAENKVVMRDGGTAMYINPGRTIGGEMLIANNLIEVEANEGQTSSIIDMVGLWIPETNWNVKVYHNSIRHTGYAINGNNTTFIADGTANTLQILNNSFVNNAGGYVISLPQASAIAALDYNNLYQGEQEISLEFGQWEGAAIETFEEWKQSTGRETHSVSVNPDVNQVHEAFYQAGTYVEEVSTDLFGQPRHDPPSIGAVEIEEKEPADYLAGTYTIGGENGDFASFSEAVAALEERGINEAVTFQVRPGDYGESVSIGEFPGNSCDRPVVFEGSTADGSQVRLINTSNSYTLQLNGADGITIRNMYIYNNETAIAVQEGTNCFTLENNELRTNTGPIINATSGPGEERSNQHRYRNNIFRDGTIGLQKINTSEWSASAPQMDEDLIIENNTFLSASGIILIAQQGYRINHNTFTLESSDEHAAISISNSWYGEEIRGNTIQGTGGVSGIITDSGAPARVSENQIDLRDGGTGIRISPGKVEQGEVLVANNRILIEGYEHEYNQNMAGLLVSGTNDQVVRVYHNSVRHIGYIINGGNQIFGAGGAENSVYIFNNSFVDNSGGILLGLYPGEPAVAEMDYNNLYQHHERGSFGFTIAGYESLEEWQRYSEFDTHSISVNPDENHLHEAFYQAGIFRDEVPADIIGRQRQDPPSIGAVEILRLPYQLSGMYTIGGSNADYPDFTAAINALDNYGTSDSVLFRVRSGTYQEQLNIRRTHDPVTFAGESGDSTDVVLEYPDGYALQINGASHYTFRHMTITGQGAVLIEAEKNGIAAHLHFENNILKSSNSTAVIATRNDATSELEYLNSAVNFLSFRNNFITGKGQGILKEGSWVIYQRGGHQFLSDEGLEISGNTFITGTGGIFVIHTRNVVVNDNTITVEGGPAWTGNTGISLNSTYQIPELTGNRITAKGPDAKGIYFQGGLGAALGSNVPEKLTGNHILLPEGGTGILFELVNGRSVNSLMANNMISVKGNEGSAGVVLDGFTFNGNFSFNSIYVYGDDPASKALSFPDEMSGNAFTGYNLHFANNIFANAAGGFAVYGNSRSSGNTTITNPWDHNVYYSNGELPIHWFGQDVAGLSEWQALTGDDENSLFADPQFESVELLIPTNPALAGAGTWLEAVPTDFFGNQRNDPPSIGAAEIERDDPEEPVAVIPFVECVIRNQGGSYTATFGYHNPNPESVNIAIGTSNRLNLLEYAGQPNNYAPGRHERAFHVVFESSESLSWTLGDTTVTVDSSVPACDSPALAVEPLVTCTSEINRTLSLATMGYHNPNDAPVAIATGRLNTISGRQDQGQPTVFAPGHHPEAFAVSNPGVLMWTLAGHRVIVNRDTPACSPALQTVQPILECVTNNGDGTYTAHFGYHNPNTIPVSAGFRPHNLLLPAFQGGDELPVTLQPGRHERVFSVPFRGQRLMWRLMGTTVTATRSAALACSDVNARLAGNAEMSFDKNQAELLVYPNFFSREITIRLQNGAYEQATFRVYSLSGRIVAEATSAGQGPDPVTLNLHFLKQGAYILEVHAGEIRKSFRVFKQ